MPFKDHAGRGRAHGLELPVTLRNASGSVRIVDIGGIPHVHDERTGLFVNLEAVSRKVDIEDVRAQV